jgi:hypothetical protein
MSTFRRNFLYSALKPPLRDSTQCLEVDGTDELGISGRGSASSGNDLQRVNEDMHGGQGIWFFFVVV